METDRAIRARQTEKVLSDVDLPAIDIRSEVDDLLALAGMAPFHRACEESHRTADSANEGRVLSGIEPWRFHVLDAQACRTLRPKLPNEYAGKVPAMLSAADALILATWLPNCRVPSTMESPTLLKEKNFDEPSFEVTLANMEHIAATAAAIENLLLAATARGFSNYWSSGNVFRHPSVYQLLGIPSTQILLGAIFLFPKEFGQAELATSKLRAHRTSPQNWSRWVSLGY